MKTNFLWAMAIASIISLSASAQEQGQESQMPQGPAFRKEMKGPKPGKKEKMSPKKRAGHLAVDMELTDAQRDKLVSYFEKMDKQHLDNRAEMEKIHQQMKQKMEAQHKANDAELEKILGPEKFKQFQEKQAQRKEMKHMRMGQEGNGDAPGMDRPNANRGMKGGKHQSQRPNDNPQPQPQPQN